MNGWHIDKRVSVGHIVTTLVVAISLVVWLTSIEKRVDINANDIEAVEERIDRGERRTSQQFAQIINRLDKIQDQLSALQAQRP